MAEDTLKNLVIGFILFSLFGALILTAVNQAGSNYGKNMSEVTGGALDFNKFNQSVSSVEQDAKNLKASFDKQSVWSAIAGVVVEGVFGIGKDMALMVLTPFDLLSDVMQDVLHVPAFVVSVILGILIISILFGIWALIKIGN